MSLPEPIGSGLSDRDGRLARRLRSACCLVVLLTLAACAGRSIERPAKAPAEPMVTDAKAASPETAPQWWRLRFRLARGADGEVESYLDLEIADRVLGPLLRPVPPDVTLWRFHRRWPDDATGHQFSLWLYAQQARAEAFDAAVRADPLLRRLRDEQRLVEYRFDAPPPERATRPGDTSDPNWPDTIQAQWPNFIMGASTMWLGLVRDAVDRQPEGELHARYRAAEAALDQTWYLHAGHAFLHHLSALFGYRPVRVVRPEEMTF